MTKAFCFYHVAQPYGFAFLVGYLNTDSAFSSHALDENAFGTHCKAKIISKTRDAAVFNSCLRPELERCNDGTGIDVRNLSVYIELGALFHEYLSFGSQCVLANHLCLFAAVQQRTWRKAIAVVRFRSYCYLVCLRVGTLVNGDAGRRLRFRLGIWHCRARHLFPNALLRRNRLGPHLSKSTLAMRRDCRLFDDRLGLFLEVEFFLFCFSFACLDQLFFAEGVLARHLLCFAGASTSLLPVRPTVTPGQHKSKTYGEPFFCCIEAECRRKIDCHRHHGDCKDAGSGEIQVTNQRVDYEATGQPFHWQSTQEMQMARQQ